MRTKDALPSVDFQGGSSQVGSQACLQALETPWGRRKQKQWISSVTLKILTVMGMRNRGSRYRGEGSLCFGWIVTWMLRSAVLVLGFGEGERGKP